MSYSAEINRSNPACFIFLIDQTGSMNGRFGTVGQPKSQALSDAVNRMLQNLIIRCTKSEGVRDYFQCAILGFGRADCALGPAWGAGLAGETPIPISVVANRPLRIEDRMMKVPSSSGNVEEVRIKFPVWIEPVAQLGRPARGHENLIARACDRAHSIIKDWISERPATYPPTVVLITDGGEEGGDPIGAAERLKSCSTSDGAAVLFCCHISEVWATPLLFPDSPEGLPDEYARMLFQMSSTLPLNLITGLQSEGTSVHGGSRGFAFNADLVALINFLDIGTRISHMAGLR
jgi:hypothetical protein